MSTTTPVFHCFISIFTSVINLVRNGSLVTFDLRGDFPGLPYVSDILCDTDRLIHTTFWDEFMTEFMDDSAVNVCGLLTVVAPKNPRGEPELRLQAFNVIPIPGWSGTDVYKEHMPAVEPPSVSFIAVLEHIDGSQSETRLLRLRLSAYDTTSKSNVTWVFVGVIKANKRWEKTVSPKVGRSIQVSGLLCGFLRQSQDGSVSLVVEIASMNILPVNAAKGGPPIVNADEVSSSGQRKNPMKKSKRFAATAATSLSASQSTAIDMGSQASEAVVVSTTPVKKGTGQAMQDVSQSGGEGVSTRNTKRSRQN